MQLAVSSWSLRDHINKEFPFDRFPSVVRERYGDFGVDAVELVSRHLPVPDMANIDRLRAGLREAGLRVVNVPIDVGNISDRDQTRRAHDLRAIKVWLDVAAELESPHARVNTGRQQAPFDMQVTIDSYNELADYASRRGVRVLLENHGGISADARNILKIGEAVGWDRFATCPDFGNFAPEQRYESLKMIAPHAAMAHAKAFDLNAEGEVPEFDFGRCVRILRESGFDGYWSAEFEGKGDQYAGTEGTLRLLRRHLG